MRSFVLMSLVLGGAAPANAAETPKAALEALIAEAWEVRLRSAPLFATQVGDPRYNDRLDSAKEVDIEFLAGQWRGFLRRLRQLERGRLERVDQINYDLFEHWLSDALGEFEHKVYLIPITNREGFHIDFARLPDQVPLRTIADYEHYLARLAGFLDYARDHIALMRRGIDLGYTLPRVVLEGYDTTFRQHLTEDPTETVFYRPLRQWPAEFEPAARERLEQAGRKAILESVQPGYRELLEFFESEYYRRCRATIAAADLPNGRAFYQHRVQLYSTLELSPEQVHEIGLGEVARIKAEMEQVLQQTGFQGGFADVLQFLRTDPRFYATSPEQLLKEASTIAKRMDGELPRLFGRLPRMPYGVRPIPEFIAPKTTGAYYNPPAGDGTRAGTYFVNTYDLPSRPLYVLEALSLHEAVPGHHLQIALQQELELPPFRRFLEVGAFVEGWALYAERLGLEVGFYTDPYSNFGRLTYEMWRACRLVVDTGLHALGWSREQAIEYLAQNTALSLHECTTEVDRYIAWPGQALGYKLGELKIRELRARAQQRLGTKFDLREFHDVVLRSGALPLPVLEQEVETWLASQ
jgi:uncharacterized protein (DUF885 family)